MNFSNADDNRDEDGSLTAICELIKHNTSLTHLTMSSKSISSIFVIAPKIIAKKTIANYSFRVDRIINSMKRNSNITELKIGFSLIFAVLFFCLIVHEYLIS